MNEIKLELVDPGFSFVTIISDITKDLDQMCNQSDVKSYMERFYGYYHYIFFDQEDLNQHLLSIRVPGGTVGLIEFDENLIITKIHIDTNYVIESYFRNVNKHIQRKYISSKLIFPKEVIGKFNFNFKIDY